MTHNRTPMLAWERKTEAGPYLTGIVPPWRQRQPNPTKLELWRLHWLVVGLWFALAGIAAGAQNILPSVQSASVLDPLRPPVGRLDGRTITRLTIEVEAGFTPEPSLVEIVGLQVGELLTAARLRSALVRLHRSGRVANAEVFTTPEGADGVWVRFVIARQLRVAEVVFEGDTIFPVEELLPRLPALERGSKITARVLSESEEILRRLYRERGYFQASIRARLSPPNDAARVRVTFVVTPGPRALIGAWQIDGNLKIPPGDFDAKIIQHPVGTPYAIDFVQSDLQRIRALHVARGYLDPRISEPRITYDPATNRVAVAVTITSGPAVTVNVTGFELRREEQRRILPVLRDGGLDDFTLEDGARQLLLTLQRRGYFFAEVEWSRQRRVDEDRVIVTYTIEPNRRYRVQEVRIVGTDILAYRDVAGDFQTRPASIIPPSRGLVTEDTLARDAEVILRDLRNAGYLQAQVVERRIGTGLSDEALTVLFQVEPGPQAHVADIRLEGNQLLEAERLKQVLKLEAGEVVTQERVRADLERLTALYLSEGFAEVRIRQELEETNGDPAQVSLVYEIEEGRRFTVNRVIIGTRGRTSEQTLRRFLAIRPGERLRRDKLNQAEQALYATGAFRQVLLQTPYVRATGPADALADVTLDVIEAKPYTLAYGFGYQTNDGPRGSFELSNANMFGRLEVGSFIVRLSRREQLAQVSYQFPRFNLPRVTTLTDGVTAPILISGLFQRQARVSFTAQRLVALIQSELRFDAQSALIFRYRLQNVRVLDLRVTNPPLQRADQPLNLGTLSATYVRDTRDVPLDATRGSFISADLTVATPRIGGSERFLRFLGQAQGYRRVTERSPVILAGRLQVGLAQPYGGTQALPISERFFSGGPTTLRGLGFEQAGPRDPVTDAPVGGNALIAATGEVRFPLLQNLEGAVFYDVGNVFARVSDIGVGSLTNSLGGGFRIKTPLGPLRVDAAYLIDPPFFVATPNRRLTNFQVHVTFGQAF
ncbi:MULTISPECIES: POTRA domain-containing protein [Chloracidobacterium]|jgi:outer membrane protein insertion porin family|nr:MULTISPECIES: outer membrane protein assembly factor [Chloracidobacterium]QUV78767.1 BamA/TamA family outer membrane protein [Chloracidobacterium thermophilum]QUV81816.1 BamA/TamA family outer membrane protein [Chloracidobacterium sp. D]